MKMSLLSSPGFFPNLLFVARFDPASVGALLLPSSLFSFFPFVSCVFSRVWICSLSRRLGRGGGMLRSLGDQVGVFGFLL